MLFVNTVYYKSFEVETFRGCRHKLQFAGKHSWLHGDLVWPNPIAQAISLEKFFSYWSIRETFPPRIICNIRYFTCQKCLNKSNLSIFSQSIYYAVQYLQTYKHYPNGWHSYLHGFWFFSGMIQLQSNEDVQFANYQSWSRSCTPALQELSTSTAHAQCVYLSI